MRTQCGGRRRRRRSGCDNVIRAMSKGIVVVNGVLFVCVLLRIYAIDTEVSRTSLQPYENEQLTKT